MTFDPSNEVANYKLPGIQHKYGPTMVVMCSNQCQEICDWCFRGRIFQGQELNNDTIADPDDVVNYATQNKNISSVLFTGGDSFLADKDYLIYIVKKLNALDHIVSYRFGTRAMVHSPARFHDMIDVLDAAVGDKAVHIVLHLVRPEEVSEELKDTVKKYHKHCVYLSQTPLLKGINDSPDILIPLFRNITQANIQPYYLFQCRPVKDNEKFLLTLREGHEVVRETRKKLSGLAKRFRYVMSCDEGKLTIVGLDEDDQHILVKYYQARNENQQGLIKKVPGETIWMANGRPLLAQRCMAGTINGIS